MEDVGMAIRRTYHWINRESTCYLVMDNAGGHGSKDSIKRYTTMLLTNYNIDII